MSDRRTVGAATPITPELLRTLPLPQPGKHTDKNTRGRALIVGGSMTSAGAPTLSGVAAFRAGAGKVHLAVPRSLAVLIATTFPEAGTHAFADSDGGHPVVDEAAPQLIALLGQVDAALIGPGMTDERSAQSLASALLESASECPFVLDALCLTGLWEQQAALGRHRGALVITPHAGEMARLAGISEDEVLADAQAVAERAARHLRSVVVLKGSATVIAQPQGASYVHERELPGLATSGSGDVLAGVLAGLISRGATALQAAIWSVYLHAEAGARLTQRIGRVGFLARELSQEVPTIMDSLTNAEKAP